MLAFFWGAAAAADRTERDPVPSRQPGGALRRHPRLGARWDSSSPVLGCGYLLDFAPLASSSG
ncbi:MAG: hypothetical protein MZW92_79690 [Comamonadaceae bacterium]|nr:hypothetical protein [Comamonadaceae bacterium]